MLVDERGRPLRASPQAMAQVFGDRYRTLRERTYEDAASFDQMGKLLYEDAEQGVRIFAGNIFEAQTVKGHTNLVVALRRDAEWMYYAHGDKVRKTKLADFVKAVEHGDLQPRKATEVDTERLTMATIGLDAIANRRTGEEQIGFYGEGAAERFADHKD